MGFICQALVDFRLKLDVISKLCANDPLMGQICPVLTTTYLFPLIYIIAK